MSITLEHTFPDIGHVKIPLYNESYTIFTTLENLKNSGSSHLDRIDHLGELRNVLHCGHHSRYEYLVFQLYMIHFLKNEANAIGLSTKIELENNFEVSSGEELLKCWAILCENGHLFGTYESERAIFYQFWYRFSFRKRLLSLVNDGVIHRELKRILKENDLTKFYRILSWLFIKYARRQGNRSIPQQSIQLGCLLIKNLFRDSKEGSKLKRCQNYFSRIRGFSHIFLDLSRLPTHLKFRTLMKIGATQEESRKLVVRKEKSAKATIPIRLGRKWNENRQSWDWDLWDSGQLN